MVVERVGVQATHYLLDDLLTILPLHQINILYSLGVRWDVLYRGRHSFNTSLSGNVVDQVEWRLSVWCVDGVVQGGHTAGLMLLLHVVQYANDAVLALLLLDLLEHKLADLRQFLYHAQLAGQLGRVNDLIWS